MITSWMALVVTCKHKLKREVRGREITYLTCSTEMKNRLYILKDIMSAPASSVCVMSNILVTK